MISSAINHRQQGTTRECMDTEDRDFLSLICFRPTHSIGPRLAVLTSPNVATRGVQLTHPPSRGDFISSPLPLRTLEVSV